MFATLSRTWSTVLFDIDGTLLDTTPGEPIAVVPGMEGLLASLTAQGIPLAIATIKSEDEALRLLDQFNLRHYFSVISTSTHAGEVKDDIVGEALAELEARGTDMSKPVLVGDRVHDVDGASANGIPAIIVEWGHGSPAEAVDAIATVFSADKLRELLLGN